MTTPAQPQTPATGTGPASGAPAASSPAAGSPSTTPAPGAKPGETPADAPATPAAQPSEFVRTAIQLRKLEKANKELTEKLSAAGKDVELALAIRDPQKRFEALEKLDPELYASYTQHKLRAAGHVVEDDAPEVKLPAAVLEKLALVDELLDERKKGKETEAQAEERAQFDGAVKYVKEEIVGKSGEKYQLIGALGVEDAVVREFVKQRELNGGVDPDDHAVAAHIEQQLEQTLERQLGALVQSTKGKALIAKLLNPASPQAKDGQGGGKKPVVNNDLSGQSGNGIDRSTLSAEEKRQRGVQAMKSVAGTS
jgi:hypothetical protein